SRWNVTYNGTGSINAFIERVEEKAAAFGVRDEQLLQQAGELFTDHALVWFRSNLLNRFAQPIPEPVRLQAILRNLQPKFQSEMSVRQSPSIATLLAVCKNIEDTAHRIASFKNPPTRATGLLEPELACRRVRPAVQQAETSTKPPLLCWNCRSSEHLSAGCLKPKRLHCFSCGKVDRQELTSWMNTIANFCRRPEISPVFDSCGTDSRPFLDVEVGKSHLTALLDTGANVTVIGRRDLPLLEAAKCPLESVETDVYTADGSSQTVLGSVSLQISLRGVVKTLAVLVVPSMRHPLVLGVDFCRAFGLALDFKTDSWCSQPALVSEIKAIRGIETLPRHHRDMLLPVVAQYEQLASRGLGRTHLVTH
ncbi:hypothetical protein CBL_21064, partial [Carabus blaptoides fortunei]